MGVMTLRVESKLQSGGCRRRRRFMAVVISDCDSFSDSAAAAGMD